MLKTVCCFTLIILFSVDSFSQKRAETTQEDRNIAKSLKEIYPDDAVVLQTSDDNITFAFDEKSKKVTVNKESTETLINIDSRADIQKYCFYDSQSSVNKFQIKNRNNKKYYAYVKDEAYKSDDLFHNDARVKYANISFPLLGYKIKTHISKTYKDIKYFTQVFFNDDYPIVKKVVKIEIPNWLEIELKEINFDGYSIKKNMTNNTIDNSTTYVFTIENLTAKYKEEDAPGPTYIYPHILILAKSYTINNEKQPIFNATQDLYNWYKSLTNSLQNDNTAIKSQVELLTKNAKTDEEKIKNIYYWVQDNIRYIAFEDGIAGFKPDEASNVYNKRYGDCKGMANLTKQMLIEAGFDARLTWIGTKRIAYDYSTPNLSVDNHMICTLKLNDAFIFLDGTEKFSAYKEYANRIQGKQALIEDGETFILKTVPEVESAFNKETYNYSFTINNDIIEGKGSKKFNGESRASLLYMFDTLKNDKKDEFLEYYLNNGDNNIKISNIETTDLLNRELSLNITYDISVKNAVSSFDKDIYVDIDFDKELDDFQLEKRKTDYIFGFKSSLESTTSLKIPEGYTVTQVPENIKISSKNYAIALSFTKNDDTIIYKKTVDLKSAIIETSDFEEWNEFIAKLKNIYNEQIVLTKS